jgi:hypothetical protein
LTLPGRRAYRPAASGETAGDVRLVPTSRRTDVIRQMPLLFAVALALATGFGCASHRNNYAYQPPLAPAVYPQPMDTTAPIAPVVTTGVPPVGQVAAPQVVMSQPVVGQPIYAPGTAGFAQTVPCDPATMTTPIQTQPCPPAL